MQVIKYFEIFYLCLFKCLALSWIYKMCHNNFHLHCAPLSTPNPEDPKTFLSSLSPFSPSFLYPLIQTQISNINIRRGLLTNMVNFSVANIPQKMKNASPQENVKGQWRVRKQWGLMSNPTIHGTMMKAPFQSGLTQEAYIVAMSLNSAA